MVPIKGRGLKLARGVTISCGLLALAIQLACLHPELSTPTDSALSLPQTLSVKVGARVASVPLDDYVATTALSEVSPLGEPDAVVARVFELQTVVARSFAVRNVGRHAADGYDLCATTHCQLYEPDRWRTSRFAPAAVTAAHRTSGIVVTYARQVADVVFHSDCGGATTAASEVWGRPVPYLRGISDVVGDAHRTWQFDAPMERLRQALNSDTRSDVGRRLTRVEVTARDASGRATSIALSGERARRLRGEEFRAIVNRTFGARAIQSTRFNVRAEGANVHFDGSGFGHGVGLCQRGAIARLRRGDPLADVVRAYFPGTSLARAGR